jgi:hypothetical protein
MGVTGLKAPLYDRLVDIITYLSKIKFVNTEGTTSLI